MIRTNSLCVHNIIAAGAVDRESLVYFVVVFVICVVYVGSIWEIMGPCEHLQY